MIDLGRNPTEGVLVLANGAPSVGFTAPVACWVRREGWWVGAADCWIILLKSCVGILREPESENAVFAGWALLK